jgi:thioredoxin 1
MRKVSELNEAEFDQAIATANVPVVLDFYAPWCGPCKMLEPLLDQLAEQFDGRVRFCKVNVDEAPELAERFEVTGVPTLLFFNNGELRDSVVGFSSPRALTAKIEALAATVNQASA